MRQRLALAAALTTALLILTTFAPSASAAKSTLEIDASAPAADDGSIPVRVTLRIEGFMCHEPRDFQVRLGSDASPGIATRVEPETLTFHVPAHAYFMEDYRIDGEAFLHVNASVAGEVVVVASFEATTGPCFVPGDFEPSSASTVRRVEPRPSEVPGPVEEEPSEPTPTTGPRVCAPAGYCGFIGDYDGAASGKKGTPGPALGVVLAGLLVAAGAWARHRRGTGKP